MAANLSSELPPLANQPITNQGPEPSKQLTAQEILQGLERDCQERIRELNVVRESFSKSQESLIMAQEAAFKSFQVLSINKERYLVAIIGHHQNQSNAYAQELSKVKQMYLTLLNNNQLQMLESPPVPKINERTDNLNV